MYPIPCNNYKQLVNSWRKALQWTPGLDCSLSVMLASIASTRSVGDQLWVKIIGPASCGKSTLCEAISVNTRYVLAKSTIRGFHTGFSDGSDDDHSLIAKLKDMTLVTKDGDTLLQSPNLGQILSEARDIYDTTSRTSYRNKVDRDYSGVRMTWILCGTNSLRSLDSSELGERFLDCVVMEGIDDELEDDILWRVVNRVDRNMALESDGNPENRYEPELAYAMQLTGGYVDHLRENATELLSQVEMDNSAKRMCVHLGKFVAYMRARPSKRQEETVEREFGARLVSQHTRLAKCLAIVLNAKDVDEEVMDRTKTVALHTSRGQTLDIVRSLYKFRKGLESRTIAMRTNRTDTETRSILRFLKSLGVVEINSGATKRGARHSRGKWVLTEKIRLLYKKVMQDYA